MLWQLIIGVALLFVGFFKLLAAGIVFSFLMIFLGIQFIFGFASWPFCNNQCNSNTNRCIQTVWFGHGHFNVDNTTIKTKQLIEYKTVFGTSELDFCAITSAAEHTHAPIIINVDTVMAKTILYLNKDIPVRIFAKAALGQTTFPDNTSFFMGSSMYSVKPQEQPWMIIYCSTVLGTLEIKTK